MHREDIAKMSCLKLLRQRVQEPVDAAFHSHGVRVARWPRLTIMCSILLTTVSMAGLIRFHNEANYVDVWLPPKSDAKVHSDWLNAHFPPETRLNSLILTAENVLTPEVMLTLYKIHKKVQRTQSVDGSFWEDHCKRIPVVLKQKGLLGSGTSRKRRQADSMELNFTDYSADYTSFGEDYFGDFDELASKDKDVYSSFNSYPQPYCNTLESYPEQCLELTILELFASDGHYDEERINSISQKEILETLNLSNTSQIYLNERNFTKELGGVSYDAEGKITGATALIIKFYATMNTTEALLHPVPESPSIPTSKTTYNFEVALLESLLDKSFYPKGVDSSPNVGHSKGKEVNEAITGGLTLIAIGFSIMLVYILLMLGKFHLIEHRAWLTVPALLCVVMGIIFSTGLCSALGLPFTDFHLVMPLILLAIGIDDAFVVVGSLDNLTQVERKKPIEERFGLVMQRAGVSVTITSITDIVAFATGASTVIPGFASFCVYCAVGLVAIYLHTITFFMATLVLKQHHVDNSRDGCFPCFKRKSSCIEESIQRITMMSIFEKFSRIIQKRPIKILVLVITFSMFGLASWGCSNVEQQTYTPDLLNPGTYLRNWVDLREQHFDGEIEAAAIFVDRIQSGDFRKIHNLLKSLKSEGAIIDDVSLWTKDFSRYVNLQLDNGEVQLPEMEMSPEFFQEKLTQFLFSPDGSQYRSLFTFPRGSRLECGVAAPPISLVTTPIAHILMKEATVYVPAMNRIKSLVKSANLSGISFPFSESYFDWETDEAIAVEFPMSLTIGLVAIFILTLAFLMDLKLAFLVILCVVLSLVNTIGFGHFWDLKINLYTAHIIIISTGLYVDYSVHVAHSFSQAKGSTEERISLALRDVGPAVFNGGVSTFLAISILASSVNSVWRLFFKSFMMITVFGLFHGLAFLPVSITLIQKNSKTDSKSGTKSDNSNKIDGEMNAGYKNEDQ